ncbi:MULTISPECIES: Gfo/Idh/MocA family protein [unclassified Microbacterium]|uniref:Gfo/Idh/MocA family protein n=1 Tax=unclassified Microbacterium TaxID=2609290 RepID=UPI00301A5F8C
MSTPQRCAIVGTGVVAHLHAAAIADDPHAEIVAVVDAVRSTADAFAARWGSPVVYNDLDALLQAEHPDVVIICTPPVAHRDQSLAALASGAHVIVEKPPAPSLDEFEEMIAAADRADRQLVVVFQQRSGTAAAHVADLLRSGALGRPLLATCETLWYRDEDYFAAPWRGKWQTEGGGTTLGHGIHQIDLLAHLMGDWTSVQGRIWRLDRETETEDASTATITFANGVVAQATTSAVSPRQTSSIRIDTQRATVTVDHLYTHGLENWSITPAPGYEAQADEWRFPTEGERSNHAPFLREVFAALATGGALPEIAREQRRSFEIVAAIYASSAAGGAVIAPDDLATHATHRTGFASPVSDMRPFAATPDTAAAPA